MRDWLLDVEKNLSEMQMDWYRLGDMYSSENLFAACRTLRQCRFLSWSQSGIGVARFNN